MHFVYNLDNLIRSIRVSDENSSITKGFQFFKHILTQDFFCIQYAPFKATSSLFNPFLTSFAIFHAFHDLFWAKMTVKLKRIANELCNGWMLARYHNFTHIACAKTWEGYGKNWMHFVYKMDNLFRSIRISDENSSVTKGFQNFNLFQLQTFCAINVHHSKPHPQISTLSNFICYCSCMHLMIFLSLMTLKLKSTTNELWKGWNLDELFWAKWPWN